MMRPPRTTHPTTRPVTASRGRRALPIVSALLIAAAFAWAAPAGALIQCTAPTQCCVDDVNGTIGANCTANDVTFTLVGLGVQNDGCVNGTGDTLSILLGVTLRNTTAQARYDVGIFIATDGDPNGDGAITGQCARQAIVPAQTAPNLAQTCPPLNLGRAGGVNGPYLTAETGASNSLRDACGDLFSQGQTGCDLNNDGSWDDTVMEFTTPVTLPCQDGDGDGFANISTCATWGQQANEVDNGTNNTCDGDFDLRNGTAAKCRCENKNTDIPMPRLSCSSTCTPATIQQGGSTSCTVTYTNAVSCTPDPNKPIRFRCGTASYIRFRTDFDESVGSVSGLSTSGSGGGGSAAVVTETGNQLIRWTPSGGSPSTPGVIAQSESATLNFTYTANVAGSTVNIPTVAWWSNSPTFSPEVQQTTLSCSAALTTPVTLSSVDARRDGGMVHVRWTTATEVGNVGFNVYEELEDGWRRVNDEPIGAEGVDSTAPQEYRISFRSEGGRRIMVEDIDSNGTAEAHGPFEIGVASGRAGRPQPIDWAATRAAADGASARRAAPRPGAREALSAPTPGGIPALRVLVESDGLYRLTYEQLAAAGLDLRGVAADRIALTLGGAPVPIRVETGAAGSVSFGPGSFVEFAGEALDTLYTGTNVYRLVLDRRSARRVSLDRRESREAPEPYYLETARVARNREYSFGSPTSDPWYDTRLLTYTGSKQWSFQLHADDLVESASTPSRLTVELWGSTVFPADPDHHVVLSLNGATLVDQTFDGRTARTFTAQVPDGVVQPGGNQLVVRLPGDLGVPFDLQNLESYALTYPRAFVARDGRLEFTAAGRAFEVSGLPSRDVSVWRLDASGPTRLANVRVRSAANGFAASFAGTPRAARYLVSAAAAARVPGLSEEPAWADIGSGTADYLIISHPAFLPGLQPLVQRHEGEGLRVRVVDVDQIYAQLSHGVVDPEAIRKYVAHAVTRMGVHYVLLVGGDSYDYRDDYGIGSMSFIPTLYTETGSLIYYAPSDALYADVDGDRLPDVAIGRLPVRTLDELDLLIWKMDEYSSKDYAQTAIFAADLFDANAGFSFTAHSEELLQAFPPDWVLDRAYLDRSGVESSRAQLESVIERGVGLTSFVGHSGPTAWTYSGLFNVQDAMNLGNEGLPTVVVQWGCWNTYFVEPRYETLGGALLLSGDRGAAAVLGSATLVGTESTERLSRALVPLLTEPGRSIGDALMEAKRSLGGKPENTDVLLGWTILGDPALVIEP